MTKHERKSAKEADIEIQLRQTATPLGVSQASEAKAVEESAPAAQGNKRETSVVGRLAWFGEKVLSGIEFIGEVVANVLGLNDSRYQWVMDTMNEQEWETARLAEEQRVASAAATNMEGGPNDAVQPDTRIKTNTKATSLTEATTGVRI